MDLTMPLFALAFAVVAHGIMWFFKTPKESASEIASRVSSIETSLHALEVQFSGMNGKVGIQISQLAENVKELAANIRELTRRMDAHRVGQ